MTWTEVKKELGMSQPKKVSPNNRTRLRKKVAEKRSERARKGKRTRYQTECKRKSERKKNDDRMA